MKQLIITCFLISIIANPLFCQEISKPDSLLTNEELLVKLFPLVSTYASEDTNIFFNPNTIDTIELAKRYPYILIGKFVDSTQTFAINYDTNDSTIQFYRLNNSAWKKIGKEKDDGYLAYFYFDELNGKKNQEIISSSGPNMNGNAWYKIYEYSNTTDSIKFAGDFCCQDSIDLVKKRIYEYHEGSWYMDLYKTTYIWNNDTLVPLHHVRLRLTQGILSIIWPYKILYFENPELNYLSQYTLVFNQFYSYKRHKKYWDDFFEIQ
jgi:hypothetical protein